MKDQILANLSNPAHLEKMYRTNKTDFKLAFNDLYPELKSSILVDFWHERLNYKTDDINWGTDKDLLLVIIGSLVAGLIAKLPQFLSIDEDFFYPRNIGFIVFPVLTAWFAWKNKLSAGKIAFVTGSMLTGLIFINSLPDIKTSDTLVLSCIHLALFLWSILGFSFSGGRQGDGHKQLGFLKYNGDLLIMTGLIFIAGMIISGVTVGLFSLIGLHIEKFYFQNIGIFGLAAAPIVGTYLTQTNPQLVGKISPVIAKLFSPLVLVMLAVYLIAMVYSGNDPYNDRDFLLIFNGLLIGVMALIFFSVSETSATKSKTEIWILFLLSLLTILVNCVALSAILFRIAEWGFTPNRAAVLGSNVLILTNLLVATSELYKVLAKKSELNQVGKVIALYLPVYMVWAVIVTFIFPLIFSFR